MTDRKNSLTYADAGVDIDAGNRTITAPMMMMSRDTTRMTSQRGMSDVRPSAM